MTQLNGNKYPNDPYNFPYGNQVYPPARPEYPLQPPQSTTMQYSTQPPITTQHPAYQQPMPAHPTVTPIAPPVQQMHQQPMPAHPTVTPVQQTYQQPMPAHPTVTPVQQTYQQPIPAQPIVPPVQQTYQQPMPATTMHPTQPDPHVGADIINKEIPNVINTNNPAQVSNTMANIAQEYADANSYKTPVVNTVQEPIQPVAYPSAQSTNIQYPAYHQQAPPKIPEASVQPQVSPYTQPPNMEHTGYQQPIPAQQQVYTPVQPTATPMHPTQPDPHVGADIINKEIPNVINTNNPAQVANTMANIAQEYADANSYKTPVVNTVHQPSTDVQEPIQPQVAPTPVQPQHIQPQQVAPTSVQPQPIQPQQVAPTSVQPQPIQPQQIAPTSVQPQQVAPTSVQPQQIAPTPVQPQQAEPANIYPTMVQPKTPPSAYSQTQQLATNENTEADSTESKIFEIIILVVAIAILSGAGWLIITKIK